jgi:caa(3)-type oxidase subunit IV
MSHSEADHVRSHVPVYIGVFLALIIFSFITVALTGFHIPIVWLAVGLGLLVAIVKGSLVAIFFMHLSAEAKAIYWTLALTGVLFLPLLFLPLFAELNMARDEHHVYSPVVVAEPAHDSGGASDGTHGAASSGTGGAGATKPTAEKEPEAVRPASVGAVAGSTPTATIRGQVRYTAKVPVFPPINMSADVKCEQGNPTPVFPEAFVVDGDGNVGNVLVYISEGVTERFSPAESVAEFDQRGCIYRPHVVGVRSGQKLVIKNSDPTLHNINISAKSNKGMNQGQPPGASPIEVVFKKAELPIRVKCDVHPWMNATVGVFDHPYFQVTGPDGSFSFPDKIKPGTYKITAWHEKSGELHQFVTVDDGGVATAEFVYSK